jgi:uncharacterized delta-60 repeat protein
MLALLPSGEVDRSFGEGGFAPYFPPPRSSGIKISHVSADSQGRLVVVGYCIFRSTGDNHENSYEVLVERYTADGRLDTTFGGGDGYVTTDLGLPPVGDGARGVFARGATVDGDDRILISGERGFAIAYYKGLPLGLEESFVARLAADGEIDRSFAQAGAARFPALYRITAPVADPNGGIFFTAEGNARSLVLHLQESGEADGRFDGDGRRPLPFGTEGPNVDATGRPLLFGHLSGSRKRGIPDGIMVKRLNLDGSLDREFGRSGAAVLRLPRLRSAVSAPDERGGTLVAASLRRQQPQGRPPGMALARLRPDGRLDRSFGRKGVVEVPFEGRRAGVRTLDVRGSSALLSGTRCGRSSCSRTMAKVELGAR